MRWRVGLLALLMFGLGYFGGCGNDLVIPGSLPQIFTPTAGPMTPTASCVPSGDSCAFNSDCCSLICTLNICQ